MLIVSVGNLWFCWKGCSWLRGKMLRVSVFCVFCWKSCWLSRWWYWLCRLLVRKRMFCMNVFCRFGKVCKRMRMFEVV